MAFLSSAASRTIRKLRNEKITEDAIIDEVGGIGINKCVYVSGTTNIGANKIKTIKIASPDLSNGVPTYGITMKAGVDGELIEIIRRGDFEVDNVDITRYSGASATPANGDVLYLGNNGDIVVDPPTDVNGTVQVARVADNSSPMALLYVDFQHFAIDADVNSVLRNVSTNRSDGPNAAIAFTAKNDIGEYTSYGHTGSGSAPPNTPSASVRFNSGAGPTREVIAGNHFFDWRTNTGAGLTEKMKLTNDGKLRVAGTGKFDGDAKEDGGVWTNLTDEEFQIQIGGVEYTIPSSIYERARVTKSANQAIASGSFIDLTFDQEDFDQGGIHDNVTNNERLTVSKAGFYLVMYNVEFSATVTGNMRGARIFKNGTDAFAEQRNRTVSNLEPTTVTGGDFIELAANDYVTLQAIHNDGASLDVLDDNTSFSLVRIY